MGLSEGQVTQIRAELQHHTDLFRDPRSYIAGIEDTLAAVQRRLAMPKRDVHLVVDRRDEPTTGARVL